MPLYSIIIPTYDGLRRLPTLLDSLARQSISKNAFEVIIVSDGDKTLAREKLQEICAEYVQLNIEIIILNENYGPAFARNQGIRAAKGEILFFTDDDCELPPEWIEAHVSLYTKNKNISMIGGWYKPTKQVLDNNSFALSIQLRYESYYPSFYRPIQSNQISLPYFPAKNTANLSVRKTVTTVVHFDERFIAPGFEDYNFSNRVIEAGYIGLYIPQFVIHHKTLNLLGYIKHSFYRGLGHFVHKHIDYRFTSKISACCQRQRKYIAKISRINPHVRSRRHTLYALVWLYCFISNSSLFSPIYKLKYARHEKKLQRLLTKKASGLLK